VEDPQFVALASAAASVYEGLIGGSVHDLQAGERDEESGISPRR